MLVIHCTRRKHGELAEILRICRVRIVHCTEALVPHHEIHELTAIEFHTLPGNTEGANKSVLNYTNNRLTITRCDDLVRHCCNLLQFSGGLVGLRDVRIHLITIKICIVRAGDHNVQTKCIVRKYLYTVTHHRHAVQCRLTVEENGIAVHEVAIHSVTKVEGDFSGLHVLQTDHAAIAPHNRLRTRPLVRSILDEPIELVTVVLGDDLRLCKIHRNLGGNTNLCDTNIWVRCDN